MFRRRSFRRFSRRSSGTSLRWVASQSFLTPLDGVAGGASGFDLTPGAPSTQWQGGTTEPTLLRIRGTFIGQPRSAVALTTQGARETRIIAVCLAWRQTGQNVLDPFNSVDLSSEDIIYSGCFSWDTRDFAIPSGGTPNNPFSVNVAGPGIAHWDIDVKAKRRVRSEGDRLLLSARAREMYTQSSPPITDGLVDVSFRLIWSLRFLYRTHR